MNSIKQVNRRKFISNGAGLAMCSSVIWGLRRPAFAQTEVAARSLAEFGGKGDGVTDNSVALLNALKSGEPIVVPQGRWLITQEVHVNGPVQLSGPGTLVMDKLHLVINKGDGTIVNGLGFDTQSVPWLLSRWDAQGNFVAPQMVQSKSAMGYQWTFNDDPDMKPRPPKDQQTTLSSGIVIQNSNRVTVANCTSAFGGSIYLLDCNDSLVSQNQLRGGYGRHAEEGAIFFGTVDPKVNLPNTGNQAIGNTVTMASFSGIQFFNSRNFLAAQNTVSFCGESGIKTGQADGTPARLYSACTDGTIANNLARKTHYDGFDIAQTFPHTGKQYAGNKILNNRAEGCGGCGFYLDGTNLVVENNTATQGLKFGISIDSTDSQISGNNCSDNNALRSSKYDQIYVHGDHNAISNNIARRVSNEAGYGIFVNGFKNTLSNNDARDRFGDQTTQFHSIDPNMMITPDNKSGFVSGSP